MIDKATNRDPVAGLKNHLEETNNQVQRLEKVFAKLGQEPSGTQCPAIDGIIKAGDSRSAEDNVSPALETVKMLGGSRGIA